MSKNIHNPYKVFHSPFEALRSKIHVVLVRPENSFNVGSVARSVANMGILGGLHIVGNTEIIQDSSYRLAKHAGDLLKEAKHWDTLESLFDQATKPILRMALSARVGSSSRAHPMRAREAMEKATRKLIDQDINDLYLVFGSESDGLGNQEVSLCDWLVTIASHSGYRSLNLAQAVLILCYEANLCLIEEWGELRSARQTQKERLIQHMLQLAEHVGFILPGDPFKMRPRLESLFAKLPRHIEDASTLHGLIGQIMRSVDKDSVEYTGRYRAYMNGKGKTNHELRSK